MSRARWNTLLGAAIVAATVAFLAATVLRHWSDLEAFEWNVDAFQMALSVAALLLAFVWGGWVWQRLLRHMGVRVRLLPLLRLWFLSGLARYVPGKIWQFVGAAQMARGIGAAPVPLLASMVIQMAFLMLSATLLAIPALLFARVLSPGASVLALAALVGVGVVLVHPAILNRGLALIPRAVHPDPVRWAGSWREGAALLSLYLVSWVVNGASFAIFVGAIVPVPLMAVPALIGANALATAAGMLVFVVPAGLGAREAALALLLTPFAPAGVAPVLAVLARLWVLAAELVGSALAAPFRPPSA